MSAFLYCGLSRFVLIHRKDRLTWNLHFGWRNHWNGLDVPVFTAGWKPLLTKFGIHHRMESSDGVRSPIPPHCAGSYASSDKGPGKIFQVPDKKKKLRSRFMEQCLLSKIIFVNSFSDFLIAGLQRLTNTILHMTKRYHRFEIWKKILRAENRLQACAHEGTGYC